MSLKNLRLEVIEEYKVKKVKHVIRLKVVIRQLCPRRLKGSYMWDWLRTGIFILLPNSEN